MRLRFWRHRRITITIPNSRANFERILDRLLTR